VVLCDRHPSKARNSPTSLTRLRKLLDLSASLPISCGLASSRWGRSVLGALAHDFSLPLTRLSASLPALAEQWTSQCRSSGCRYSSQRGRGETGMRLEASGRRRLLPRMTKNHEKRPYPHHKDERSCQERYQTADKRRPHQENRFKSGRGMAVGIAEQLAPPFCNLCHGRSPENQVARFEAVPTDTLSGPWCAQRVRPGRAVTYYPLLLCLSGSQVLRPHRLRRNRLR
jgi:hypothetical protein